MDAEVRFLDGETRSFARVRNMRVRDGAVIIRRWFRTVAIIPVGMIRWTRLIGRRKVSQRDFGKVVL